MLIDHQIVMSCSRIDDRLDSERFVQGVMIDLTVDFELFGDDIRHRAFLEEMEKHPDRSGQL